MADAEWTWRAELNDLLRACRSRRAGPGVPGRRRSGLRQDDAANLAGLSLRRYAAFERGEFTPAPGMVDQVAAALQMSEAERSALHVLAAGQDPPRPVTRPVDEPAPEPSSLLRDLITQIGPYPSALTDETWSLLYYNQAMTAWSGGWYDRASPRDRNLICYLFSKDAQDMLPDIRALRRFSIAAWRYQYTRNLASPRFSDLVTRLTGINDEAAALWALHELVIPPHEYPVRVRHPDHGLIDTGVICVPVRPRLWLYSMVVPPGVEPFLI
jgi:transcriptional regulator with XRE-family HTH domain